MQVQTKSETKNETNYQKYKDTHTKCARKYRSENREILNEKQRDHYWEDTGARERKLEMMRLYRLRKKEEKLAEAKARAEENNEVVEEVDPKELEAKDQRLQRNKAKRENRKKFMAEVRKEEEEIIMV